MTHTRRDFLFAVMGLMAGSFLTKSTRCLGAAFPHFFFTQLKYRGGEWDPKNDPFKVGPGSPSGGTGTQPTTGAGGRTGGW